MSQSLGTFTFERQDIDLPPLDKPPGATCCPAHVPGGLVSLDWLSGGKMVRETEEEVIVLIIAGLTGSRLAPHSKYLHLRGIRALTCTILSKYV